MNHLELWIDGNKIGDFPGSTMSASVPLATGPHTATLVEVDSASNFIKSSPVAFIVGSTPPCGPPSSPGAILCTPAPGSTDSSPVSFTGAGTGASGSVNHLELWIDGNKIGDFPGNTMSASVPLATGSHTATLVEVDSASNFLKSTPVTFTVGGGAVAVTTYHNDLTREGANTAETISHHVECECQFLRKAGNLFGGRPGVPSATDHPQPQHQRWHAQRNVRRDGAR